MTCDELGARMTSAEFTRWLAFEAEYGFPDNFTLAAHIFQTVFAALGTKPVRLGDIVPYFKPPRRAQTGDEMFAVMAGIAAGQNRKDAP